MDFVGDTGDVDDICTVVKAFDAMVSIGEKLVAGTISLDDLKAKRMAALQTVAAASATTTSTKGARSMKRPAGAEGAGQTASTAADATSPKKTKPNQSAAGSSESGWDDFGIVDIFGKGLEGDGPPVNIFGSIS